MEFVKNSLYMCRPARHVQLLLLFLLTSIHVCGFLPNPFLRSQSKKFCNTFLNLLLICYVLLQLLADAIYIRGFHWNTVFYPTVAELLLSIRHHIYHPLTVIYVSALWRSHGFLMSFVDQLTTTFKEAVRTLDATIITLTTLILLVSHPVYSTLLNSIEKADEIAELDRSLSTDTEDQDKLWFLANIPHGVRESVVFLHLIGYCGRKLVQCFIVVCPQIFGCIYHSIIKDLEVIAVGHVKNVNGAADQIEFGLERHKLLRSAIRSYDQHFRWIHLLAYLEALSLILSYIYAFCKEFLAHDGVNSEDAAVMSGALALLIVHTTVLTSLTEKQQHASRVLRYLASLDNLSESIKRRLSSHIALMDLQPSSITIAGLEITRETCVAVAAGILGYTVVLADLSKDKTCLKASFCPIVNCTVAGGNLNITL